MYINHPIYTQSANMSIFRSYDGREKLEFWINIETCTAAVYVELRRLKSSLVGVIRLLRFNFQEKLKK